ncbi:MAG: phosphatidylserine decarboxylase [Candidatus Woesearchaeota archaeon]
MNFLCDNRLCKMISTKKSLLKRAADKTGINDIFHMRSDDVIDESLEYVSSPCEATLKHHGIIGDTGYIISKHKRIVALENLIGKYSDRFKDGIYLYLHLYPNNKHYFRIPYDGIIEYIQKNDPKSRIPVTIGQDNIFGGHRGLRRATEKNANIGMVINAGKFSYAMIAVGSLNVNHITVNCEEGKMYRKGYDAGHFSVGSTILLCFDKGFRENSELKISDGEKTDVGNNIIHINPIYVIK